MIKFDRKKSRGNESKKQYKKGEIDFQYAIDRKKTDKQPRFVKSGNVWKQCKPAERDYAVVLCAGDLMCEPAMSEAAYFAGEYDFRHCFKYIAPVLEKSDLALANLETMVTDKVPYAHEKHRVMHNTGMRYHCNAPVSYLDALRFAGFDGFAMANNHSADGGYDGIIDTIDNVDNHGFMRTGAFKDDSETRILLVEVNGIRIGILSYTEHINRNLDREVLTEKGCNIMMNRFDPEKLKRDISTAKAEGAEFLLCYIHFLGKEYSHEILKRQRETAQIIADAGVDCIMGSHTHSIQEYDVIVAKDNRRVPVVYSLGNFITSDNTSMITRKSVIYKLVLKKENGKVMIARECYIPCRVIEDTLSSSFKVFPALKVYRKNRNSTLLDEAQKEIAGLIGNLNEDDGYDIVTNESFLPSENDTFDEKRQLTIGRICNIAGIDISDISREILPIKINYFTVRYTWVRKGCAYFSRFTGNIEEKEARLAYSRGASVLFCTKPFTTEDGKPMPCIVVDNPLKKFYEVSRYTRSLYDIYTIGITGSVGKTTTKEMLYKVLNSQFVTLKSMENANSYPAIADAIQKLKPEHQIYIQEIGAFSPGVVEGGSYMLKPNMCVITNIGYPHVDLYGSIDNILYDKTSLIRELPKDGTAFLNYDDERLRSYKTDKKVVSFGIHNTSADYVAKDIDYGEGEIHFTINCKEGDFPAVIYMVGEHNVLNALVAFAVGRHVGISADAILASLADYRSEGMRQNVLNVGGYNLYMDCYNSAPNSILTSVHALSIMEPSENGKKVAVIGDIPRLGSQSEEIHRETGHKLLKEDIDLYIFFGKYTRCTYDVMKEAGINALYTDSRETFNSMIKENVKRNDIVLFKAGHPMALAKTVDQVWGTSFHITDGDVLLDNSKYISDTNYEGRWIDGVVEIRKARTFQKDRVIPAYIGDTPVGRIGKDALSGAKMETLTLPETLYNIGFAAFYKCVNLRIINFAKGLRVLERSAFNNCNSLTEVELPDTLIDIGKRAFADCGNLRRIHIPRSVGHISDDAFSGCKDLTICCDKGSYAETFALSKNYNVEIKEV